MIQQRHGVDPTIPDDAHEPTCLCGRSMHWVDCYAVGCDDGYVDDYEIDPLWYDGPDDPDALQMCDECHGYGGWWICDSVPSED